MTRDELVEAGVEVILVPNAPDYLVDDFRSVVTRILDAVEPLIRADEMEATAADIIGRSRQSRQQLRAKVEALRDEAMDHARNGDQTATAIIAYQTVLALLDGSSDGP
jgi:hypothetical protein